MEKVFDYAEATLAIVTWTAATAWGIRYLWRWIGSEQRSLRPLVFPGIAVVVLVTRFALGFSWLKASLVVGLLIAGSGAAAALITGAWEIDD